MKPPLPKSLLRTTVLRQYKDLLIQSNQLFDANARQYIANRIRSRFRDNLLEQGAKRLNYLLAEGRKSLHKLKRANLGDVKAVQYVLNRTYGRVGQRKHQLLERYFTIKPPSKESVPSEGQFSSETPSPPILAPNPRNAPPIIPSPIQALMKRDPDVTEKFVFDNPAVYKSSKTREINARWKHYSSQLKKLRAPLHQSEVEHLQSLAVAKSSVTQKTKLQMETEKDMKGRRLRSGKFQGHFSRITPRFMRRRYQSLIKGYIPVITQVEGGKWHVDPAQLPSSATRIPPVHPRHMNGHTLSDGSQVGEVSAKGAFTNSLR